MSSRYQHRSLDNQVIGLDSGKVVCVGRNYLDHIHELNNEVPQEALLFIKPSTALADLSKPLVIPKNQGECHNELELAVLIRSTLSHCSVQQVQDGVWGVGLGLDLTLRDVQARLKSKGLPWERAKGFDSSCPLSRFVPAGQLEDHQALQFSLKVNGEMRQRGDTTLMMRDTSSLIAEISRNFTLLPGDVVLTGTPKGVGPLEGGDKIEASLDGYLHCATHVL